MSFVQNNWMLIAVFVLSGGMLIWPFVQRRLSPVKDVTSTEATQLFNRRNAVLLDVREPKEFEGGKLPGASLPGIRAPLGARERLSTTLSDTTIVSFVDRRMIPSVSINSSD